MKRVMLTTLTAMSCIGLPGILGCKKKMCADRPPDSFYFKITKNGSILPDSVLSKMSFFFYDKDGFKIDRIPDNYDNKSFFDLAGKYSEELKGVLIGDHIYGNTWDGISVFYLKYPDDDIDTMYLKTSKTACDNPISIVIFNGKYAPAYKSPEGTTHNGESIYLFEK